MITIKKSGKKFEFPNDSLLSLQDTHDGMYFKFKDGTELRFELRVTPAVKAISQIVMKARTPNINIDFDNPQSIISLS